VAKFSREAPTTAVESPVEDQSAADSSSQGYARKVSVASACAENCFPPSSRIGIIFQDDGKSYL